MTDCQTNQSSSAVKASYWFPDGESTVTGGVIPRSSAIFIDSDLFTHLFCAFADLDSYTHKVVVSGKHEYEFSTFTEIVKQKNRHVQTLLSIGGRNADTSAFAYMARNPTSRKSFIDSSIMLARSMGFNGLDLAWEYPSNGVEMSHFGTLLEEWRSALEEESERTDKVRLLLTAAVYYTSDYNSVSYPIQKIENSLNWVNLIAYEFYGLLNFIGAPAALYNPLNPQGPSGDSGLKEWIKAGLPEKKAVFGFPYVGWAWTLEDANNNGYDAAITPVAMSAAGSMNYDQIIKFMKENMIKTVYDSTVVQNYCFACTTLILYDDIQTVVTKVGYAKDKGLLGYFAWNVGADDDSRLSSAASREWNGEETTIVE